MGSAGIIAAFVWLAGVSFVMCVGAFVGGYWAGLEKGDYAKGFSDGMDRAFARKIDDIKSKAEARHQ